MTTIHVPTHVRSFLRVTSRARLTVWLGLLFVILELFVPRPSVAAGSWIPLAHTAPDSVGLMILLSDGTVMAANNPSSAVGDIGNNWYRLTPDASGHYVNGAWSNSTPMNYTRLFYSAQLLQDGRLFLAGGEYGTGRATAEVFDPLATNWTVVNPPSSVLNPNSNSPNTGKSEGIVDAESKVLDDGNVLLAPIAPSTLNGTLIYNPSANTWSAGPQSQNWQAEVSWVKLPDGSILTVDPLDGSAQSQGTNSERYMSSLTPPRWVPDANLPVNLWVNLLPKDVGETGPAFLLPNGKAFFLGGSGHTAIYTPSPLGGTNFGSWVAGPDIPGGLVSADAPAAMMPNGKILCAVSAPPYFDIQTNVQYSSPTSFFEYDYANHTQGTNGSFTQVNGPTGLTDNIDSYQSAMLVLPDGGVLYCHFQQGLPSAPQPSYSSFGSQLYIYVPDSTPVAAGKPVINNITINTNGSFTLTGTGLNGISAGAAYGDDLQMDSNYPLVRFTDGSGNVYYARTFNWSSTGVMTGNNIVSTEFTLPANLPAGINSLVVVANGIASDPVAFNPLDYPTVAFTSPAPGAVLTDSHAQLISGTAAYNNSAIGAVQVALTRSSDGVWFNFTTTNWGTTTFDVNHDILIANGTTSWSAQLPALPNDTYTVHAQSLDVSSHASAWQSENFSIALPVVLTFNPLTNGQPVAAFSGIGGNIQNYSAITTVSFGLYELDINGGSGRWWNGTNFQSGPAALPVTVTGTNWAVASTVALPQLNSGQSYQLTVTASNSFNNASTSITVQAPIMVLNWDPGQTPLGTVVLQNPNTNGGNYWFQIIPQSPAVGVWRTALNVLAGEADVYMSQGSPPTTASATYHSQRVGSDGFVLDASQFSAGQSWYILVNASAAAQWNLVTGDAFVYQLGSLAADNSSSTNAPIGAEGMIFFATTVPANTLAWQLWLNGPTTTIYVKKSFAPDPLSYDLTQAGQMLVVPPYLAGGTFYFISVPGNPGTSVNLGSRQQPVTSLPFNSFTTVTVGPADFPYVTYQVQVPVQQIAWQLNLTPSSGVANVAARLAAVPNEFRNDAYSDIGGSVGNSLTLVPPPPQYGSGVPGLSAGTYYVTVYGSGTYQCGFTNGSPVITPVSYVFNITNDAPNRVGWRFYGVSDINSQLGSFGWLLQLSNAPAGSEIAIRRNAVPGQWNYRNNDDNYYFSSAGYVDLSSYLPVLEQPGHQADIWYVGVYSPTQALGNFVLSGQALPPPVPQPVAFDGAGNSASETNQAAGVWQYFQVVVPAGDANLLGWDLRLTNVTAGSPQIFVSRDTLPPASGVNYASTTWPSGAGTSGGVDWTGCGGGPMLEVGMGNPLEAGTYYIGVQDPTYTSSYTLVSRGIGLTGYSIPVKPLNLTGSVTNLALPVGEAAYYQVVVTNNTPDWKLQLKTVTGDALLLVEKDSLPSSLSYNGYPYGNGGQKMNKLGDEQWAMLPDYGNGSNVTAGAYYVLVASQGQNLVNNCEGTGASSYTLRSWIDGVTNLIGTIAYGSDATYTNSQPGGAVQFYQFTVPANVASIQVTLENAAGSPVMTLNQGTSLVSPVYSYYDDIYGNYGGTNTQWVSGSLITIPNPTPGTYSLSVYGSDGNSTASYTVRVHALPPTPLAFDGAGNSASETNQAAGVWQYFQVVVPAGDANLLGWDLRLTNVTAGSPQIFVSRDTLPPASGVNYASTTWPSGAGTSGGVDWTGCGGGPMLEVGMGNPLEAGTYYIGVQDPTYTSSYTLVSRGIGLTGYSIPVKPLNLTGSVTNLALPVGEAAYYQVVVTNNTPDWKLQLKTVTGDALLLVEKDSLPSSLSYNGYPYGNGGQKMNKLGDEQWAMLPDYGNGSNVTAGTYYVLVASQGQNLVNNCEGTGASSYTLRSWIDGVTNLMGTIAYGSDATYTNSQPGGAVQFYQFTVPANVASIQVTLENAAGSPVMTLNQGTSLVSPVYSYYDDIYGNYGGTNSQWVSGSLITIPNPTPGTYSLSVYGSDGNSTASYTVRVHALLPAPLAFDGTGNSVSKTNQAVGAWQYFKVVVPVDANLLGWDLRLTNVTAGNPQIFVCRDLLPPALAGVSYYSTAWPSGAGTGSAADWTGCAGTLLEVGMGNPLQAGTYYIGVQDPSYISSYTVVSRGIGLTGYSIPVKPLNLTGSVTNLALPVGEAAYYQVMVASNTPNWKLQLKMVAGDALMLVEKDSLPNNLGSGANGYLYGYGGQKMNKPGDEQWAMLPDNYGNGSNVMAGTYYVLVASQGQNLVNNCEGSGTASYTLRSWIDGVTNLVGTLAYGSDASYTNSQPGGSVQFYQFTVLTNTASIQVTLQNTVGNPVMTFSTGTALVSAAYSYYYDVYGNYGGNNPLWASGNLVTIPNPTPGTYSLSVYAADNGTGTYPDASYKVDVSYPTLPQLSFSPELNTSSQTNVVSGTLADAGSTFYRVSVPTNVNGAPVLGWNLQLSQSSGSPSVRVRQNLLPDNTYDTTAFASGSIIIAPPYLAPGIWYVEVKASGSTTFTLTTSVITTNTLTRSLWTMPAIGQTTTAPGLALPEFGDTGVNPAGANLPGDQGVDLAQGQYDFYAIMVPTNNAGLLRTELQAISGNPTLYLRAGAAPTSNHGSVGNGGSPLIDRQLSGSVTEYGNWVPLNGQTATNLTPGLWVLSVYASGNANVRFRLQLSCGSSVTNGLVQDMPLNGSVTYTNQQLAGGDWRYYRVQIPTNAPNNLTVTWSRSHGTAHLFVRDTVPPGDGAYNYDNYNAAPYYAINWASDLKNQGPYPDFAAPGSDTLTTPPLRPGATYYLGFWSPDDATFSFGITTNGGSINITNIIAFYGGSVAKVIPGNGTLRYRLDVPLNATRILFNASNSSDIVFSLEQGTVALAGGPAHWNSSGQANTGLNQFLGAPNNWTWPWLPGYSYYLTVTNTSAAAESFTFAMTQPADLAPVALLVPASVTSAAPNPVIQVIWGVTNQGAATATGGWYDTLWFSADGVLDANSVALGSFPVNLTVPAAGSYRQTNSVILPMNASGTYTLFVQVDANNAIYEATLADKVSAGASGIFTLSPPKPVISSFSLSGKDLVVNGANGFSGATCYVLMTTNMAKPLNQWTRVATNILGAAGNFTITATNAVDPKAPVRLYILQLQ